MARKISAVIPVFNEAENIKPLYQEVSSVLNSLTPDYEIIFINDGSCDLTQNEIEEVFRKDTKHIRAIQLRSNFGKATALHAGFRLAEKDTIVTLDGDLQDDPHELPKFLQKIDEGYDIVSGWKQQRKDSLIKNITSKLFNYITNLISKVKLHDFNCGFKVYRSEPAKSLTLYGELHRYIPVLAAAQGYRIAEVPIVHRKRIHGTSKYNSSRFIHGFLDLSTVLFLTRFRARPLHFFGIFGMIFFLTGFIFGIYLSYIRLFNHQSIGNRPLLLLSVMLMIMGVQIGVMGLVGEQITTMIHRNGTDYPVKTILGKK